MEDWYFGLGSFTPVERHWSLSIPPENIRKPPIFSEAIERDQ